MIVYAIALALVAAVCDYFFGIPDPWRKIVYAGIVIVLIIGVVDWIAPGLFHSFRV